MQKASNVQRGRRMKVIQSGIVSRAGILATLLYTATACDSVSAEDRSLVRADAEVFETIVRSEIPNKAGDSTVSPGFLRVDARPVGDNASLANGERPRALDLERSGDSTSTQAVSQITDQ